MVLPSLKQTGTAVAGTHKPYVIFSFGQPWGGERVLSKNLVTVVVTYCRALNDFRVKNSVIHDELLFEAQESKDIRIISPTQTDIEAETFLNPGGGGPVGTNHKHHHGNQTSKECRHGNRTHSSRSIFFCKR